MWEKIKRWWINWRFKGINLDLVEQDLDFPDKDYYPFYYRSVRVEQNPYIFAALDEMAKAGVKPAQIFEIGYRNGGLTLLLDDHPISKAAKIYSYDKIKDEGAPVSDKVTRIHGDFFHKIDEVGKLIRKDGLSLVFCDGGDKNSELRHLAKHLKVGDIILAHDYISNAATFEQDYLGKKWDWHECWDGEIDNACRDHNLVDFMPEVWHSAVWCCKIKER